MNKRQSALAVTLVLMLAGIWFATRYGYRMLLADRMTAQANAALEAVSNGYDRKMLALGELTFTHASWDDMYEYVQRGRGEAVIRLAANASKVASYVLVFNDKGALVFSRTVDMGATGDVLETLAQAVRSSRLLSHQGPDSAFAAPAVVARRPLLVVSRPVLPTSRKGAIRGSIVVAAEWDPARDARQASVPPVAVDVYDLKSQELPADVRAMAAAPSARKTVRDVGDGRFSAYLLMDDIGGTPAVVVRASFIGGWTAETERQFRYFAGLLGAIGCVFLLVFVAIGRGSAAPAPAAAAAVPVRHRGGSDEGEVFYRTIAAKTRDGLFTVDPETRVITVNQHGAEYFNTSPDRVLNKFIKDLVPPDAEKTWRTNIADAYRLGIAVQFEYQAKIKGDRVPVAVWLVPFKDKNGAVYKLVGVSRPAAAARPRELSAPPMELPPPPPPPTPQDMLRLFDGSDQALIAVDPQVLSVVYLNDAAAALWGVARADALGKPLESVFPAEVASSWKKSVGVSADGRQSVFAEEFLQTADREVWLGVWMVPLSTAAGDAPLVAALMHDITHLRGGNGNGGREREELAAVKAELLHAREAVDAERHRFLAAFDQINEIIFAVDAERLSLTYVNRFTAIQWNSDINDLLGKPLDSVFSDERAVSWRQHVRTAVDTGTTLYAEENVGIATAGLTAGCWVVPVRTLAGVYDTVLVISHDVTDVRRNALEMQRKDEEISRLRKEMSELPLQPCTMPNGGAPVFSPALAAERLAPAFDDTGLSVFMVQAATGQFCYLNAHAAVQWNGNAADALGKTPEELLPSESASLLRDNIGTVLALGSAHYYEDSVPCEGGTRWVGTWLVPVRNQVGAIEKVLGIAYPVTELRTEEKTRDKNVELDRILKEPVPESLISAEQELALEQRRLLSVFDGIDEIVYVVDPRTYEMLYVNPTFRKVFGEDFTGRKCFEVFQGAEAPCAVCSSGVDTAPKAAGTTHTWECRNNLNQGWYHCLDGTMTWSDGRTVCYKIAFDITERRFLEEKLFQVHKQLQITFEQTVNALAETMKSRNVYTARHQLRVANLACAIAREMGFHSHVVDGIRMASLIHDIGYVSIPAEILDKRGQLTAREVSILKMHPQVGYNIIKTIPFPWPVAQMVLQHHERLDGTGYPLGLTAEDIIVEARIVGVADVIEAMANYRPYRPARGLEAALDEVSRHRGTYYDPDVVDACLGLFKRNAFKF